MKASITNNHSKVVFAALLVFFMAAALAASAGAKSYKAEIISPADGSEINSGKEITVKVKLTNMDMMSPIMGNMGMAGMGEKIKIEIEVDDKVVAAPELELTSDLAPGASTELVKKVTVNFSSDKKSVPFCTNVSVGGYNDPQGRGSDCGVVNEKVFATAVADVNNASYIHLYPNPASDKVVITSSEAVSGQVTVFDLAGRVVLSGAINGKEKAIEVSALSAGTYLYNITDNNGNVLQNSRLVINR